MKGDRDVIKRNEKLLRNERETRRREPKNERNIKFVQSGKKLADNSKSREGRNLRDINAYSGQRVVRRLERNH